MFDMWIMELGKILHLERVRFIKEKKEQVLFSFLSKWESFIILMGKSAIVLVHHSCCNVLT